MSNKTKNEETIPAKGDMTVAQAAQRGGQRILEKYGRAHFQTMNRRAQVVRRIARGNEPYIFDPFPEKVTKISNQE